MKQARHLNKIRHSVLSLSKEDAAAALKSGLENGCRERGIPPLEHISLSNIRFQKDALTEICHGFRNNQSLPVVALICCGLADEEMVEVADSLASHPSLHTLRLAWNRRRSLGLQAFVRLLAGK